MREWQRRAKDSIHTFRNISLFSAVSLSSEKRRNWEQLGAKLRGGPRKLLIWLSAMVIGLCYVALWGSIQGQKHVYLLSLLL